MENGRLDENVKNENVKKKFIKNINKNNSI